MGIMVFVCGIRNYYLQLIKITHGAHKTQKEPIQGFLDQALKGYFVLECKKRNNYLTYN
jgi:hypothetical protein